MNLKNAKEVNLSEKGMDIKYWKLYFEEMGIYWLLIDRENKRNSFSERVVRELEMILDYIGSIDEARVLIISSISDRYFSAGADIKMFLSIPDDNRYEGGKAISVGVQRVFGKVEKMEIPVIAAVKGLNLTAGLELSMACDMIIAADNAKFGQIETKYGITPGGGGTQRLTRLVGPLKARELIYTARIIDAREAESIGLVNKVVPLSELENEVRKISMEIIKNSRRAIAASKKLINEAIYINEQGFKDENDIFGEDFESGEPQRRLKAFLNSQNKG